MGTSGAGGSGSERTGGHRVTADGMQPTTAALGARDGLTVAPLVRASRGRLGLACGRQPVSVAGEAIGAVIVGRSLAPDDPARVVRLGPAALRAVDRQVSRLAGAEAVTADAVKLGRVPFAEHPAGDDGLRASRPVA
jgi:hypothetical protein